MLEVPTPAGISFPWTRRLSFGPASRLHPPAPCLPNLSTTFSDDYLADDDVLHPIDLDDDAPIYSIIKSIHMDSGASCLRSRG